MMDDVMFNSASMLTLDILSLRKSAPIYEYIFSYEAPFGMMKNLFHVEEGELLITHCGKLILPLLMAVQLRIVSINILLYRIYKLSIYEMRVSQFILTNYVYS